jgi:hypothetical protein
MRDNNFISQVVREILAGVKSGLTRFSGLSRVAVIFQLAPADTLYICDPLNLLRGHETRIQSSFFDAASSPIPISNHLQDKPYSHIERISNIELDGVISVGGQSGPVLYQMWFTEHHPEILSTGPTRRWLEHAALRFSHDVANKRELYSGISGRFLREYATHAVNDHIQVEMARAGALQARFDVYPILNAILAISKTREETKSAHGELVFVEPASIDSLDFLARFHHHEQPTLTNHKHVRKLLQAVQKFRNHLVSDGVQILGIARGRIEPFNITADFRGLFGFLRVNNHSVCSFADGAYSSATHQAKLFQVEEALLDYELDSTVRSSLFHIVASIVHYAETEHFGCAIVIDLNHPLTHIAGQNLEQELDLERSNMLDLACDLARVDGALQIGVDRHLHRFACLLDGPAIPTEDRARGARYNSALRFTARNPHTVIVVISADRPVSVIRDGVEYNSATTMIPDGSSHFEPRPIADWLAEVSLR